MEDTPLDALRTLVRELSVLRPGFDLLDAYYKGEPPKVKEPDRLTKNYQELLEMGTSNWCRLVVEVPCERLIVEKIKTSRAGRKAADGTTGSGLDDAAWAIWQRNNMDAFQMPVHRAALKYGINYVGVDSLDGQARIKGQSPLQVHVRYDEETDEAMDAIRMWVGRDRYLYCTYYTPETVRRFRSEGMLAAPARDQLYSQIPDARRIARFKWVPRTDVEETAFDNPLGRVPFVAFPAMLDVAGDYQSEITPVMHIQKRINKTLFDRLLAQEFTAFPQRWATGIDIPKDDNGDPIETLNAAIDRVWTAQSPETAFGQFAAGDISPYLAAEQSDVQALATQSRTPPHYLLGGMGTFPSGESVRATEYGLSRKIDVYKQVFGERWCDVVRLSAIAEGDDDLAKDDGLDVEWSDVEARSEGERVDALLKMATLGVPRRVLWEKWGATPQEIPLWDEEFDREQQRMADLGYTTTTGPTPVPPVPPDPQEQADANIRTAEAQAELTPPAPGTRGGSSGGGTSQTSGGQRDRSGAPKTAGSGGTSNRPGKPKKPNTSPAQARSSAL